MEEKKITLTFLRRMANSNNELMKKYNVGYINKLNKNQIYELYLDHKINIDDDIIRLKKFILYKNKINENKINDYKITCKYNLYNHKSLYYAIFPFNDSFFSKVIFNF